MGIAPGSVWLDARGAQSTAHGERGIPRYVAEHARALVDAAPELIGSVGIDPAAPPPPSLDPLLGSGVLTWHSSTRLSSRPVPTTYHVMSPFEVPIAYEDIWPAWAREAGCRLVVTLYDLIPIVMRDQYLNDWGYWATGWMSRQGLMRSAHQVLTISQQTADDAMERLRIPAERLTVIDSGVSGRFSSLVGSREAADSVLRKELRKVEPGFLLYVGGPDFRKNLKGTIEAYSRLPEPVRSCHQLVIACKLDHLRRFDLRAYARQLGIAPGRVILTGFVPDRVLAALYRSCELFVFSSLYEGAGLPILEAMSCGAPVAASNTSAMPELLGDLDATFDPADPADIARCIREVLESPGRLDSLRERSRRRVVLYTWERVAERTLEGYERASQAPLYDRPHRGRRSPPSNRKRLAVVTPWPAPSSEVAAYSRRLVEALDEHADVDVVVAADKHDAELDRSLQDRVGIRTDAQFEWLQDLMGYDRCLFVLSGSPAHLHVLGALLKVPGVVLAHDVRLLDLYRELHRHSFPYDPYWLEGKLVEMYGDRIPLPDLRRIPPGGVRAQQSVNMTTELQAHAQLMLVHSRHQADLLALERPPNAAQAEVVPHAIPEILPPANRADGAQTAGVGEGPHVVASGDDSLWPKLLDAFAELKASLPGARLTILGEIDDQERRLEALRSADLAVHLRAGADGGTVSGQVCDCIAARIPTIVSESGWEAELPVPVVLPVPTDCTSAMLAEQMASALTDDSLRERIRSAQDAYASANSFARVAERYAELLTLA